MELTLKILGTASAMPISDRNPSAQVLSAQGRLFLIDCGEGCQQQMRRMHISIARVDAIFISHIHGDHIFGLFGLLNSIAMYGRKEPLKIYAPSNFGPILNFYCSYFKDPGEFQVEHSPLTMKEPQVILESGRISVSAFPLRHKIDCYGYRFDCLDREGNIQSSYAYCSDTVPFPELAGWVRGVSTLYHEATYPRAYADKAAFRFHSTTDDAARCALEAGVGRLLIGHYSSRERDTEVYRSQCAEIFPNTVAAEDGSIFTI